MRCFSLKNVDIRESPFYDEEGKKDVMMHFCIKFQLDHDGAFPVRLRGNGRDTTRHNAASAIFWAYNAVMELPDLLTFEPAN
jgi:hypothetical protein